MKISPTRISFKGYDAAPLKRVFLDATFSYPFVSEMEDVAKKEGFEVEGTYDYIKWVQDDKAIVEKENTPYVIGNGNVSDAFFAQMRTEYGIQGSREFGFIAGGNSFIGKYPDGTKWMLVGNKQENAQDNIETISK